jgi:hypothetical protein
VRVTPVLLFVVHTGLAVWLVQSQVATLGQIRRRRRHHAQQTQRGDKQHRQSLCGQEEAWHDRRGGATGRGQTVEVQMQVWGRLLLVREGDLPPRRAVVRVYAVLRLEPRAVQSGQRLARGDLGIEGKIPRISLCWAALCGLGYGRFAVPYCGAPYPHHNVEALIGLND